MGTRRELKTFLSFCGNFVKMLGLLRRNINDLRIICVQVNRVQAQRTMMKGPGGRLSNNTLPQGLTAKSLKHRYALIPLRHHGHRNALRGGLLRPSGRLLARRKLGEEELRRVLRLLQGPEDDLFQPARDRLQNGRGAEARLQVGVKQVIPTIPQYFYNTELLVTNPFRRRKSFK